MATPTLKEQGGNRHRCGHHNKSIRFHIFFESRRYLYNNILLYYKSQNNVCMMHVAHSFGSRTILYTVVQVLASHERTNIPDASVAFHSRLRIYDTLVEAIGHAIECLDSLPFGGSICYCRCRLACKDTRCGDLFIFPGTKSGECCGLLKSDPSEQSSCPNTMPL